jgi:hypothetical protein
MAVLTEQQQRDFQSRGFVKLAGAFGGDHAADQRALIWQELREDYGILEHDRSTWRQPTKQLRRSRDNPIHNAMVTVRVIDALDSLLGQGEWTRDGKANWGSLLITFPNAAAWDVPQGTWHWDSPTPAHRHRVAGIQLFSFLAPTRPGGGATVFVEGIHHILLQYYAALSVDKRQAKHATHRKRLMSNHPWLRELSGVDHEVKDRKAFFMQQGGIIDGVEVRVLEMAGDPGDVYLLHPLLVHCWASNALDTPRMMRSKMIVRKDFQWGSE